MIIPAYQALGINAVMVDLPGRRALFASNSGKTDAELCRIDNISQHYPNLVKVEPALQHLTIVALSIKALPQVKTMADLKAYKLGSQRGMKAAENYFRQGFIHYVNNYQQVIQLLDDGLIDYAILPLEAIKRHQQANYRKDFFIHQPPLFQHKLYHYIHKRHQHLVAALALEISLIQYRQQQK
ncbi:transporter substrate-binding domain-containing protein [Thalassomonas sp. RHCl1]|uniref:transporter substrate-binding domain-containing protein n=1 Tax=Thalassomonas sp. RHCl1 TaxID=2995320 RepID=UPI00248AF3EB|nr:transporter substrate-binding domain-containing protein [Thalassomonas sp. RHCl1]